MLSLLVRCALYVYLRYQGQVTALNMAAVSLIRYRYYDAVGEVTTEGFGYLNRAEALCKLTLVLFSFIDFNKS